MGRHCWGKDLDGDPNRAQLSLLYTGFSVRQLNKRFYNCYIFIRPLRIVLDLQRAFLLSYTLKNLSRWQDGNAFLSPGFTILKKFCCTTPTKQASFLRIYGGDSIERSSERENRCFAKKGLHLRKDSSGYRRFYQYRKILLSAQLSDRGYRCGLQKLRCRNICLGASQNQTVLLG